MRLRSLTRFLLSLSERYVLIGAVLVLLVFGVSAHRSYGVPYDEGIMDALGRDAYAYVFEGQPWPSNPDWRYHGPVVELGIKALQNVLVDDAPESAPLRMSVRRLTCWAFFLLGLAALYALARRQFESWRWALLTASLLLLTPRMVAHGLYNSRDIPQLALFTLSMLTLVRLVERRTWKRVIAHGLVTAIALALRMTALLIPALTLVFLVIELLRTKQWRDATTVTRTALMSAVYLGGTALCTIALWPFLWEHPLAHFLQALHYMSSLGQGSQVFLGRTYTSFPWIYIPVWISITVPLVYTVLFLLGAGAVVRDRLRTPFTVTERERNELLFLLWCVLPIASVYATGAGIYTEWRHLYFLYPGFLLLAVTGFRRILAVGRERSMKRATYIAVAMLSGQMLLTGAWMVRNHPYEYVYFSIPASVAERFFPLDYWAVSYAQTMAFILHHADRQILRVYSDENPAFLTAYALFPESLQRIVRVPTPQEADVVLTRAATIATGREPIYVIHVDGMTINGAYYGGPL